MPINQKFIFQYSRWRPSWKLAWKVPSRFFTTASFLWCLINTKMVLNQKIIIYVPILSRLRATYSSMRRYVQIIDCDEETSKTIYYINDLKPDGCFYFTLQLVKRINNYIQTFSDGNNNVLWRRTGSHGSVRHH